MLDGEGGLEMFSNRLRKNKKELSKKARRNQITCFRIYDKDVPQVPVALDCYSEFNGDYSGTNAECAEDSTLSRQDYYVLQYFRGPYDYSEENDRAMDERIGKIRKIVRDVFDTTTERIFVKLREKKKGNSQYGKLSREEKNIVISEGSARLWVNLSDYLDTGIFLDHRPLRNHIAGNSRDKNVLNLFCYTGSFSVHAGLGGAHSTTSIDLSPHYLEWTRKNLFLNGLNLSRHRLIEADVVEWLRENRSQGVKFDTIILDPPTFSNSKKFTGVWDLQRDYANLINLLLDGYLNSSGEIYFSCNFRKFKMDPSSILAEVEDITEWSIPFDYRDKKIHRSWKIYRKSG